MSIFKKTSILVIILTFTIILTACNKSRNSNSSIVDNSINITTEEANDITEEVTADTVTESTKDSEESEDDTKKNSKASSKKKSKKTSKEATTESDNTAYKTDKKTESKSNKTNNKADNKSDKSNKAAHKSNDKLTCSLKIECKEILDGNIDKLSVPKRALVPKDGIIYDNASVTFEKGDTVWDVLSKEVKRIRF